MKSILMSIQPKYCELIASGKKTIEVRKTVPKLETPFKCYIYCTKDNYELVIDCLKQVSRSTLNFGTSNKITPDKDLGYYDLNGKVIGEFVCDKIYHIVPHIDCCMPNQYVCGWEYGQADHCLTFEQLRNYLQDNSGYGWHISQLKIYDKPKELGAFKKQNPCYYSGSWEELGCWERGCVWKDNGDCDGRCSIVECPPQSWMYVEELKSNEILSKQTGDDKHYDAATGKN